MDEREQQRSAGMDHRVEVNGEPVSVPAEATVVELLEVLGVDASGGVAVAVDGAVVPRSQWSQQVLATGSRVEVIRAVQGG